MVAATKNDEFENPQGEWRLRTSLALYCSALIFAAALLIPIAIYLHGYTGFGAVGLAVAICSLGGCGSLVLQSVFRSHQALIYRVLLGMALRMGIPLGAVVFFFVTRGPLEEAGIVYYLLVIYLSGLLVDTCMAVSPQLRNGKTMVKAS